jgi:hypothetical protein
MLAALTSLILAGATIPVVETPYVKGPIKMKPSEIRAYNANLSPDHPNYIRCVREVDTGSLAKRTTSCRTNAEWRRVELIGNEDASRLIEKIQTSGSTRGS